MGVVYRAVDPVLDRPVAIKVMNQMTLAQPEMRRRFELEARAVARLQHPNVVTLHELDYDALGYPYIVMEFLEGEDLETRLGRGPLELEKTLDIARQACAGLSRVHDQGLVHRDLKPANLFLTQDGIVKVMDFGLARFVDAGGTIPGTVMGTAEYMSPEQVLGGEVDVRADVFGVGVLLYRMLTGERPFRGTSIESVLYKVLHLDVDEVELYDGRRLPALERVVLRAIAKKPDERYSGIRELSRALVEAELSPAPTAIARTEGDPEPGQSSEARRALDRLLKLSANAKDFPILRHTAVELMSLPAGASADRIAELVSQDQAFATQLLKVVNSAYFNRSNRPIESVSRAVVVLGNELVKNICLSLGFTDVREKRLPLVDLKRISAQAFFAATLARGLARSAAHTAPEEVFTAALLYNIPDMAVAHHMPALYLQIREQIEREGLTPEQAESRALGLPFSQVGERIATGWDLPKSIVRGMSVGPDTLASRARTPAAVALAATYLANATVRDLLSPSESGVRFAWLAEAAERGLGLGPRPFVRHVERAHEAVAAQASAFGVPADLFRPPPGLEDDDESESPRAELIQALLENFDAPPETGDAV
jgi:serine/threonine protein kinase